MPIRLLSLVAHPDRPTTETFIGFHRAGVDITVACPAEHPHHRLLVEAGVPTVSMPFRHTIDIPAIRRLRRYLIEGGHDIVHAYYNDAVSNAAIAVRGLPVRLVAYRGIVGAVGFLDPVSWLRFLNPRIDRITCVCDAIRRHFLSMRPAFLRMPPDRPVTIYKGHKLEWYTAEPADLTTLGLPADAFVIGCISNYRPRKGIEYLVDAMARLPADVPAHLLLVGRMRGRRLDRAIANSPVRDRIHRPGFREDAPSISAACDVFCLPSIKREGLPRSVIEAMAYRVPPVVTDSGGSPELVQHGRSGLVVPVRDPQALADAITRLYRDPALRRRLGEAARERIANDFRNETTVRRMLELYASLVPDKAATP